jgi:hypothetical protein
VMFAGAVAAGSARTRAGRQRVAGTRSHLRWASPSAPLLRPSQVSPSSRDPRRWSVGSQACPWMGGRTPLVRCGESASRAESGGGDHLAWCASARPTRP